MTINNTTYLSNPASLNVYNNGTATPISTYTINSDGVHFLGSEACWDGACGSEGPSLSFTEPPATLRFTGTSITCDSRAGNCDASLFITMRTTGITGLTPGYALAAGLDWTYTDTNLLSALLGASVIDENNNVLGSVSQAASLNSGGSISAGPVTIDTITGTSWTLISTLTVSNMQAGSTLTFPSSLTAQLSVSSVPEPASAGLAGAGLLLVAAIARRRRR